MQRNSSRGNTAVAALLLVTLVGGAAFMLDSAREQSSQSQLATSHTAATATKTTDVKDQKCVVGYDYVVRMDDKGVTTVKPTLADPGIPPAPKERENQCKPKLADNFLKNRKCDATWKCDVWMCIPGKFTKDKEDEECRVNGGEALTVGKAIEMPKQKSQMADIIADHIRESDTQRGAEIFSETKKLDSTLSNSVFNSLGGAERAKEVESEYKAAQASADELRRLADNCSAGLTDGPDLCGERQQQAGEAQRKADALRDESQKLAGAKQVLAAPSGPPCPPGERCIDDGKGGLKVDDRSEVTCETNKNQAKCNNSRFPVPPPGSPGSPDADKSQNKSGSGFNLGDLAKMLPLANQLLNMFKPGPSCTIKASPTNITQPGQSVTLTWTSENAQQAYLSNQGQVGPSGSVQVQPQGATTYSLQVMGMSNTGQQQQQQQVQYTFNPYTNSYMPTPAAGQQQGTPQYGNCQVQVTVGKQNDTGGGSAPKAQISCQPKIADTGMQVSLSYACQNSTTSSGKGFTTGGALSGSATSTTSVPASGSTTNSYALTCSNEGRTDTAECTVNVNRPSIVLVANPKNIDDGDTSTIGWVTGAMEKCIISSPTLSEFTEDNKNNTSTSGSAKTPELDENTEFVLKCTTKAGGTKTATTTVEVD